MNFLKDLKILIKKINMYIQKIKLNKDEREFRITNVLSIIGIDDFKEKTHYLDFNPKENYDRVCPEDELDAKYTKEIYDRYCKHTIENVLPKIKKEFSHYYKTFRLEETIPAFLKGITINKFYD